MVREVDIQELAQAHKEGAFVLDVREPDEYDKVRVPGAKLIPLATVPSNLDGIPKNERVYVICASGGRSFQAAAYLASSGYDAVSVSGGTMSWLRAGYPVQAGSEESAA